MEGTRIDAALSAERLDAELEAVRTLLGERLSQLRGIERDAFGVVLGGKMLRARLAVRLAGLTPLGQSLTRVVAAAVEMAHAASLLHDDVIDGAELRRGRRAFWRLTSTGASILTGDLLLVEAACLLADANSPRMLHFFCRKVREMCEAEAVHELIWRGRTLSEEQCLNIARGKTGALFAFVGGALAGDDEELGLTLEECGYRLGTAYQLADDLLDLSGAEGTVGKTLGTDFERGKMTLPALYRSELARRSSQTTVGDLVSERITELLGSAPLLLEEWPQLQAAVTWFIDTDLLPAIARCFGTELNGQAFLRRPLRSSGPIATGSWRSKDGQ